MEKQMAAATSHDALMMHGSASAGAAMAPALARVILILTYLAPVVSASRTAYLRRRLDDAQGVDAAVTGGGEPQTNGQHANDTDTDADPTSPRGGGDGGVPLDGEFFLMFTLVLLIVFAVLFLPVIWKCFKVFVAKRKISLSDGEGGHEQDDKRQAERTKEDVLDGVATVKEKIAEESRLVRDGMKTQYNDGAGDNEEELRQNMAPPSGRYYGTYYFKNKARMTHIDLTFSPHPHGGYVIHGSGEVQSGETEITEGYLAPSGEAYFVEMGGINPNAVDMDVSEEELTSRRLSARDVIDLIVLYRGKFDFTQPNIIFTGWRYSSTGIHRTYHLLKRPRDKTIRHFMSTIGSSIHTSIHRRRSSTQQTCNEEEKEEDGAIEWTGQQGFPCPSKA